jgi:hypothetical protein
MGILPPQKVGEFEKIIMVAVRDRIDGWWNGCDEVPPVDYGTNLGRGEKISGEEKILRREFAAKCVLTEPISL